MVSCFYIFDIYRRTCNLPRCRPRRLLDTVVCTPAFRKNRMYRSKHRQRTTPTIGTLFLLVGRQDLRDRRGHWVRLVRSDHLDLRDRQAFRAVVRLWDSRRRRSRPEVKH